MSKILIVEDEEAIAKMIAMNLKVAGYETTIFYNGQEAALQLESCHSYDLALLDIMVPGLDGFGMLEYMNKYGIPTIFLTAKDDVESKINGLRKGAEDYIVKPFEVLELLVRIEKVLERNGKNINIINILGFTIDIAKHTVFKDGIEISLKPMEFDLLVTLVKNRNIAVSREMLLKRVWGVDFIGETRTVDVHIGQLRKKLGITDNIKTISKMGYRLED